MNKSSNISEKSFYVTCFDIKTYGVAYAVINVNTTLISGVKLLPTGNKNFSLSHTEFNWLLEQGIIEFGEVLDNKVYKSLKKTYKKNLK